MPADGEILSRYVQTRSEAAFEQLVRRHGATVYGACLRVLGDPVEAEDAAQATFMVLAGKAAAIGGRSLAGWLHATATLVAREALRARRRRRRREEEASRMAARNSASRSAPPAWAEVRGRLDAAVAALPADQRDAVVLAYFQGLSREEVARETGCSRGTVDSRLGRALEKLRRVLAGAGSALPAAAMADMLAHNALTPLPAGVLKSLVAAGGVSAAAASPAAAALAKGAMQAMFWMKVKLVAAAVTAAAVLGGGGLWAARLAAGEPPRASGAGTVTVLSSDSCLRSHLVFKTPVMITKDGQVKPVPNPNPKEAGPLAEFQSPLPPADWVKPDFNDSAWEKDRAPIEAGPEDDSNRYAGPSNSLICARAKFTVEDPARVQDLKLAIEYVGGAVVHVNGQELTRGHMPSGEVKPDTLAEKYPDDLYCEPNGQFVQVVRGKLTSPAGFERRFRKLADVAVPAKLLRKGVNVLAVAVHRAAINEAAIGAKRVRTDTGMGRIPGIWAYAGLKDLSLTAAAGSALAPNVERPKGIQVWNCAPFDTVTAFDYGDGGALQPVVVSSPRNGVFSGRLAVSSDGPIRGLKVAVSDLASSGGGGKLPAAAVRVRCAQPGITGLGGECVFRHNALAEAIPAEIPVIKAAPPGDHYPTNYMRLKYVEGPRFPVSRKSLTAGAVAPIWLTVRVPKDAAPGSYQGTVTVSAAGLEPTAVPLEVIVSPWTLPDPKDLRITSFGQHSPDSLANCYNVPLWSDRHFELMGKSMALMAELNSREALAELAIDFYGLAGNQETMVRWIKQPDGSYKHDFTVFDKYLDTVAKQMGKPALLRINCWGELRPGWGGMPSEPEACWKAVKEGKKVSLLDPATGKVEPMEQPVPGTQESHDFWKPVLDEVRRKIEARGWWDVTAMGHNSYNGPAHPTVVGIYKKIWPDGAWSYTAHNGVMGAAWSTTEKGTTMPVRYADCVWTRGAPIPRGYRALLKPRPGFWCYTFRTDFNDTSALIIYRDVPEEEIMSGHDGVSDFGVDFFAFKSKSGKTTHVGCGRGTGGPTCTCMALLAPGPDGPMASERFEMLREGVELGEAILFLERSLQDKKISGELEARVSRCLDERGEAFLKRWPAGRFERDLALLALAGEVAAAK